MVHGRHGSSGSSFFQMPSFYLSPINDLRPTSVLRPLWFSIAIRPVFFFLVGVRLALCEL